MVFYLSIKKAKMLKEEPSHKTTYYHYTNRSKGIKLLSLYKWTGLGCLPLHIKDLLHILRVSSFMKEDLHAIRLSASASFRGSNDKV
jgi:hypothetical protein